MEQPQDDEAGGRPTGFCFVKGCSSGVANRIQPVNHHLRLGLGTSTSKTIINVGAENGMECNGPFEGEYKGRESEVRPCAKMSRAVSLPKRHSHIDVVLCWAKRVHLSVLIRRGNRNLSITILQVNLEILGDLSK